MQAGTPKAAAAVLPRLVRFRPGMPHFAMTMIILVMGFLMIYPVALILVNSLNVAPEFFGPREWGLRNWTDAWARPGLLQSLGHTLMIWTLVTGISFPLAVIIAWTLARTNVPFSHGFEFLFWISFMTPPIATTVGWIMMADPNLGFLNALVNRLPFINMREGPLNIFTVPGIVWAHLMANGVSVKVMLLTPAFRNMDRTLEEAGKVSGASTMGTMFKVTLPLMMPAMALVLALQMLRIFQSFEIEQLLGIPFQFHVYSTMIFDLVRRQEPPMYGQATVLASLTLLLIAFIIPFQRWILQRQRYTTVGSGYKPGLANLGPWKHLVFAALMMLILLLTAVPMFVLGMGSFMTRVGFFNLNNVWTLNHWQLVLTDPLFLRSLRTTFTIAITAGVLSPLIFSVIAYIIVRTRWPGRGIVDTMIWVTGAIPGILAGLGLLQMFLGTPGLSIIYGSIFALLIVVVLQGNTLTTNMSKATFIQVGQEMEESARISGAGWVRTYIKIWIPLIMPTLILLGTFNFVLAAGATSQVILLASRDTMTLSIMALELMNPRSGQREAAGIVALIMILMTVGVASIARYYGLRMGIERSSGAGAGGGGAMMGPSTR